MSRRTNQVRRLDTFGHYKKMEIPLGLLGPGLQVSGREWFGVQVVALF